MKFITSSEISLIFDNHLKSYKHYKWTVAWAGSDFDKISMLENYSDKIDKLIIGIHFYQTHPDFIKKFYKQKNVKFILKPSGIYHPKLYLFENDENDWAVIIGSHNFTNSAFNMNSEASVLITSNDVSDIQFKNEIDKFINESWNKAERLKDVDVENYSNVFDKQSVHLKNLTIRAKNSSDNEKLLLEIEKMSWDEFYYQVKENEHIERIKLLDTASSLFGNYKTFNDIPLLDRKGIAGFYNNDKIVDGFNWFAFGNMRSAGYFKGAIIESNSFISEALDCIPLKGDVTKNDFKKFTNKYLKFISNSKNPTATATRLLTMKRPDYFFCFNSKNKKSLAKAFEIKENLSLMEYWDIVLETIYNSDWWNDTSTKKDLEKKTFNYRVAFIDNLYFEAF